MRDLGPKGVVVAQSSGREDVSNMTDLLTAAGHHCQVVNSATDFDQIKSTGDKDVFIFDLHKPLIEGVGIYAEMRRAGITAPIIILTDSDIKNSDAQTILRDFRATGILNKPFDPFELLSQLRSLAA